MAPQLHDHEDEFVVFGCAEHHGFHAGVMDSVNDVAGINLTFAHISYNFWPDGESGSFIDCPEEIEGKHVIIFTTPVNDKLELQLRDLVCACKWQYGAKSVSVVMTFMRYRRQDRPEKNHEITRLRWFLHGLKAWGVDHLIVCDPHNLKNTQQYCTEAGVELHVCMPTKLFANRVDRTIKTLRTEGAKVVGYAPDFGSIARVLAFAIEINTIVVATPKERLNGDTVNIDAAFDQVEYLAQIHAEFGEDAPITCDQTELEGAHVFMLDDELSTGGTAASVSALARKAGAASVRFIATHPVCSPGWKNVLRIYREAEERPFDQVFLGTTRPRGLDQTTYEGSTGGRVERVDITPTFAHELIKLMADLAGK